jgi:hypothetical protein
MRGDSGERPLAAHWEHERVAVAGMAARVAGRRDLKKSIVVVVGWLVCGVRR